MELSTEIKNFIKIHKQDNLNELLLKKEKFPDIDLSFVAEQIEGRRKAKDKLPEIFHIENFIFPKKESMEQCSSELTARYKASLFKDFTIADITGGLGIDSYYFSETNKRIFHVERNPELQEIANHNFKITNKTNIESFCSDSIDFLKNTEILFDIIYVDPARRDKSKNKVFLFQDCEPNILEMRELLFKNAKKIVIKVSPFLDISKAINELKTVSNIYILSVKNECKELLLEWEKEDTQTAIHCIDIKSITKSKSFDFSLDDEKNSIIEYANEVQKFIYEPNVSISKAGCFRLFGKYYNLRKLHPNSHLYTSNDFIEDFFGKSFSVEKIFSLNKQDIKKYLPKMKANIIVKNFPMTVDEIKNKFKIQDGGDIYLFATTLGNEKIIIRAKRLFK